MSAHPKLQIGTYQASVIAKANNKPVYAGEQHVFRALVILCMAARDKTPLAPPPSPPLRGGGPRPNRTLEPVAESFKFLRSFPLSQADIPPPAPDDAAAESEVEVMNPHMDYTPPSFISLLFTDLGE